VKAGMTDTLLQVSPIASTNSCAMLTRLSRISLALSWGTRELGRRICGRLVSRIVGKVRVKLAVPLLFFAGVAFYSGRAQIAFTNLDFEDGVFVPVPGSDGYVKWDAAMPGWKGYIDESNEVDKIGVYGGLGPHGLWSLPCCPGSYGHLTNIVALLPHDSLVSIAQTATLPTNANLVTFYSTAWGSPPSFNFDFWVTFNDQQIWLQHLATIPAGPIIPHGQPYDFEIWGGDISRFAGQTGTLMFTAWRSVLLDNIRFYPTNAPHTRLKITATATNTILLEWADAYPGAHTVEQTSELYLGAWMTVPNVPISRSPKTYVTLLLPTKSTFYRLKSWSGF
jgi:hypothetical protein